MKVTKFEHACLLVEEGRGSLIIDPGQFSASLPKPQNVEAIVITHIHPDHFDPEKIKEIIENNPDVKIFSTTEVVDELGKLNISAQSVTDGDAISSTSFSLQFFGDTHAQIHNDYPVAQNSGVFVNKDLYYPGDSFTVPDKPVNILAVPLSGPWLKASEVIDFIRSVKPKITFPTHDALFNEIGHEVMGNWAERACQDVGSEYRLLKPGESISA